MFKVLLSGVNDYPGDPGKSVEIFDLKQNIWREGPQLPEHLDGSPGLAEVEGVAYVVGGYGEDGISSGVFWLEEGATAWKAEQGVLKMPKGIFLFVPVLFDTTEC